MLISFGSFAWPGLWPSRSLFLGRCVQAAGGRFKIAEGVFQQHKGGASAPHIPRVAILALASAYFVVRGHPRWTDLGRLAR
jgi:hypothetical protein